MNTLREHKEVVIGVVIALIVGVLLGYGWGRQMGGAGDVMMSSEQAATSSMQTAGTKIMGSNEAAAGTIAEGNSVSISDQGAGSSVMVVSATLTEKGWVAIRDENGTTLGAALFSAGTHTDVSISLLKPTQAGHNYQALIYFDDGSKTFDLKTETIVLNPDGSVAGATFNAK